MALEGKKCEACCYDRPDKTIMGIKGLKTEKFHGVL
jgi:hypothetical protein